MMQHHHTLLIRHFCAESTDLDAAGYWWASASLAFSIALVSHDVSTFFLVDMDENERRAACAEERGIDVP
jgi:hypothetical protein